MTDAEVLAEVLRRFIEAREFFFITDNSLTLDGTVDISMEEVGALLRASDGWLEADHVRGKADDEFYVNP